MTARRSRALAIVGTDDALAATCNLPPRDRAERGADVRRLLRQALHVEESAAGVAIRFPATNEIARAALDVVLAERVCCPRFRYELGFEGDSETFVLLVAASGNDVAPLRALYRALAEQSE
jgi:hypothetical protein